MAKIQYGVKPDIFQYAHVHNNTNKHRDFNDVCVIALWWLCGVVAVCVCCGVSWLCLLSVCVLSVCVRVDGVRVCLCVSLFMCGYVYVCPWQCMCLSLSLCICLNQCVCLKVKIDRLIVRTSFSAWCCMAVLRVWSDASG